MPAARAIASWPTSVSTQPRLPQAHAAPARVDRDVPELAAEPVRAAEEPAAEDDAAADADLAEDADEVVDPDGGARPVLGERREVRLVLDVYREPEPRLELAATGTPCQPRFGARTTVPVASSTSPGTATETPAGRRPSRAAAASAARAARAEPLEHGPGRGAAVVAVRAAARSARRR